MNTKFPHLFSPLRVKNILLKNRIMSAPNMLFHTVDGRPTEYYAPYLEHKARGGAGIVNLGEVSVGDGGNHVPEMKKTWDNLPLFADGRCPRIFTFRIWHSSTLLHKYDLYNKSYL